MMNLFSLARWLLLMSASLLVAGCGHIDVSSTNDPNRVLKGAVAAADNLPAGAEIVVRLIATTSANVSPATATDGSLTRPLSSATATERVLGEQRQILAAFTTKPVPFRIEYQAGDALLRHGINLEARISIGGKLRFRTINAHVVTLASASFPQEIAVQPVQ